MGTVSGRDNRTIDMVETGGDTVKSQEIKENQREADIMG